ncbi:response regulator [bacterium]|nr:response regulator [bacterium]
MKSVLLVDDDTHFRRSLSIGLETMGYQTYEAGSGMEALEFLQCNQKDNSGVEGIVIDARMPGLDGFWLADQISTVYPLLRIIILSAHSYSVESDHYMILTKPIHLQKLAEVLESDIHLSP